MRIGILTGGGDAPGTNAVIRALTRSLIGRLGAEVLGIEDGYQGLEPEFDLDAVVAACRKREARQRFTVVCVAEGAKPRGGVPVLRAWVESAQDLVRLGGVAEVLARQLQPLLKSEMRAVVRGHVQHGGLPTASDRVLSRLYGSSAVDLVAKGAWGQMDRRALAARRPCSARCSASSRRWACACPPGSSAPEGRWWSNCRRPCPRGRRGWFSATSTTWWWPKVGSCAAWCRH